MMINYMAVIVCAIAAMIIGMVWYGPFFKKAWIQVTGMGAMTPEAMALMKKRMGGMIFAQFVMSLISVFVLAHFMNVLGTTGVSVAFWVWFGFLMPTAAGAAIWSGKPRKIAWMMFFITAGAELVTFLVYGLILGAWR